MKKASSLIFNHINSASLVLALLIALVYCLCAGELCRRYTVRFDISTEAKGPTEIKFYYTVPSRGDFNEGDSKAFMINNEANSPYDGVYEIYVPIREKIRLWRFDLGDKPGKISINNLFINNRPIDESSFDFKNLAFSPHLELSGYKDGEYNFVSKGNDPYFVIDQQIRVKPKFAIRRADYVVIVLLFAFFITRDLLSQYKKYKSGKQE